MQYLAWMHGFDKKICTDGSYMRRLYTRPCDILGKNNLEGSGSNSVFSNGRSTPNLYTPRGFFYKAHNLSYLSVCDRTYDSPVSLELYATVLCSFVFEIFL